MPVILKEFENNVYKGCLISYCTMTDYIITEVSLYITAHMHTHTHTRHTHTITHTPTRIQ